MTQKDKNRNSHRKAKLMLQTALKEDQKETLYAVKKLRGIDSSSELIRQLLVEEKKRLKNNEKSD